MLTSTACHTLAAYNRWMNERLYAVCAALPDSERRRDRGAFFHSIHGTRKHMTRSLAQLATGIATVLAVSVAALASASSSSLASTEPCSGCTLLGSLSVQLSSVEPAQPAVGDVVTLTFMVTYALPGGFDCGLGGTCQFEGGAPYLEGDEPPAYGASGIVVQRRVVQAGVATVQLNLTAETEEACRVEDPELGCMSFFQPAFIHASTGPLELDLQEGSPTPTATPTPTPTATATRRSSDDDGCAIGRSEHSAAGGLGILLLPVLLLRRVRRH